MTLSIRGQAHPGFVPSPHIDRLKHIVHLLTILALLTGATQAWAQNAGDPALQFGPFVLQASLPVSGVMAVSGDTALVAATGVILVFDRDPESDAWSEDAVLAPSDVALDFGRSLAIEGDLAIVGAEGAAYIFERQRNGRWRDPVVLHASDGNPRFGAAVDIDTKHAIVGAPNEYGAAGAVYVFARKPGRAPRWSETASLESGNFGFGYSVGISGDFAIVADSTSTNGIAHIFGRTPEVPERWPLGRSSPQPPFRDFAGVAIDGDTAAALWGELVGVVSVFSRNAGGPNAWGLEPMKRTPSGGYGAFVQSVAISGNNIAAATGSPFVLSRNQGELRAAPPFGGANAWGATWVALDNALPLPSYYYRFPQVAISGDTILIRADPLPIAEPEQLLVFVSDIDRDGIRDGRDPCPRDPFNNIAGRCHRDGTQYPVLNDVLAQQEVTTAFDGRRFTISATFTNTSDIAVSNPFFEVTELTGPNVLVNSDAGRGRVGATLSPDVGDGILSPGESMRADFVIRVRNSEPFRFEVSFKGEVTSGQTVRYVMRTH